MMRDYARMGRRMRRGRRGDRGMHYGYDRGYRDFRGEQYGSMGNDYAYSEQDYARGRRDYESGRQSDMARRDYGDMRDMHYGERQGNFRPVEAMGYFTGYYGGEDYARGGRGRGRDYGYDYNYDYAGDYGEGLTKDELEEWKMKLMKEVEDKDKNFFTKENISSKARNLGVQMKDYNEEELCLVTLMMYTDYCKTIKRFVGANMDIYIELAKDWLEDKDSELKGSERLAVYHDCIIEGDE